MKFVLSTIVTVVSVMALTVACRTTGPVTEDSGSGLSEISVPLPEAVASSLGSGGQAELIGKTSAGANRSFVSAISKFTGAARATSTLKFDIDQSRQGLRVGDELKGITLYLRDEANNAIYIGQGNPADHVMTASVNKISFDLTCANTAAAKTKCNGLENVEVVAIQGAAGQTSASIEAEINIKSNGLTFGQLREKVKGCMVTFDQHRTCSFWDTYSNTGEEACNRLAAKETELRSNQRITSLANYVGTLESIDALNYYVTACKDLGIFKK